MGFDLIRGYVRAVKPPAIRARLFDDGASEYFQVNDPIVLAPPFTMVCWARSDTIVLEQVAMCIADSSVPNRWHALGMNGAGGGDPIFAYTFGTAIGVASTTSGYLANTWHHIAGVWPAADLRAALIDGGSKGTNNVNSTVAGVDRFRVSSYADSTPSNYLSGSVALPAIWQAALTDSEIWQLCQGVLPWHIRPESLLACWDENGRNLVGNRFALTAFNTPGWSYAPDKIKNMWILPRGFVPGGATFNQAAAGVWSGAGSLVKETQVSPDGTWSGSGALIKQTQISPDGVWSGSGASIKQTEKELAGTWTGAGALIKQAQKELAGIFTSSGSLVRMTEKELAGIFTSSGALATLAMHFIDPTGIASAEAFGATIVMLMDQYIIPGGIATEEAFGLTRILGGERLMGLWEHILLRLRRE